MKTTKRFDERNGIDRVSTWVVMDKNGKLLGSVQTIAPIMGHWERPLYAQIQDRSNPADFQSRQGRATGSGYNKRSSAICDACGEFPEGKVWGVKFSQFSWESELREAGYSVIWI